MKEAKFVGLSVELVAGHQCVVFRGKNDDGSEVFIALPETGLRLFADEMRSRLDAAAQPATASVRDWQPARFHEPEQYKTGEIVAKAGKKVGLWIDPETPRQTLFAIQPRDAVDLAKELDAIGNRLLSERPETAH